ncbi:hypothetical protein EIN_154270 [Entamoeba invadens IP1]|uniref:Uncharacterized protein n=1 Tax=Entamoeba invadens IP1 TaxID=370355 RepID=A0A0A1U8Z3_ENTIV|nr:hypothetical protein EIN_154270 [Entamoeba invadens IP1]ELP91370.1 hypothetical protein EIN_154270 [Entamoeba invadens IP1]|eukprot:XP_004258141.1 hypothetical protein EIN_154270 [Entamoeba invadens IP1]
MKGIHEREPLLPSYLSADLSIVQTNSFRPKSLLYFTLSFSAASLILLILSILFLPNVPTQMETSTFNSQTVEGPPLHLDEFLLRLTGDLSRVDFSNNIMMSSVNVALSTMRTTFDQSSPLFVAVDMMLNNTENFLEALEHTPLRFFIDRTLKHKIDMLKQNITKLTQTLPQVLDLADKTAVGLSGFSSSLNILLMRLNMIYNSFSNLDELISSTQTLGQIIKRDLTNLKNTYNVFYSSLFVSVGSLIFVNTIMSVVLIWW